MNRQYLDPPLWRRWADEWFDAVPEEADAKVRYLRLAALIQRYLRRCGADERSMDLVDPGTEGNHLGWRFDVGEPRCSKLSRRWWGWDAEMKRLCERYPRLALREALADVSEGSRGESWPYRYERAVLDWVKSGRYDPVPQGLAVSRTLFDQLVALHKRVSGWWYWDPAVERRIWHAEHGMAGKEDSR